MRVSECCGVTGDRLIGDEVVDYELSNMCPRCKEYCTYVDDNGGRSEAAALEAQYDYAHWETTGHMKKHGEECYECTEAASERADN